MKLNRRNNRRTSKSLTRASSAALSWLGSQELTLALRPHMAKVHWAEVVGEQVAGVTQVESVRDGVLAVRVKNAVWANELDLLREDILRRLNLKLGGRVITHIRFKGSGLEPELPRAPEKPRDVPTEEELALILLPPTVGARVARTVARIQDEALRERFHDSLLRVARVEEWKRQHGWRPCRRCATPTPPDTLLCALCRAGVII